MYQDEDASDGRLDSGNVQNGGRGYLRPDMPNCRGYPRCRKMASDRTAKAGQPSDGSHPCKTWLAELPKLSPMPKDGK